MEWIGSLAATFVLFLLVVPAVVAVGSVILLGVAGWAASCMEPRFALLSGDVAYRPVAGAGK